MEVTIMEKKKYIPAQFEEVKYEVDEALLNTGEQPPTREIDEGGIH
jgi:hypothetical protein